MKKLFLVFTVLSVFYSTASAQFDGIKIMVNPGHGGHDSNDRFIEATGYWESEGNLTKGLYLRDLLEARGAEVIMSRTENTTADDLPLSQIVAIANSNEVDWMHSIHSNAYDKTSNYTLLLYQGFTDNPTYSAARSLGITMARKIHDVDYTTGYNYAGDFSFYGTGQPYLGVFKGLNMPGTLSEGSFHDYIPESWRLMNLDYRKHEAVAMLRAFLQQFDLPALNYGDIAGLARDKGKKVSYTYNSSLPNDQYIPINNLKASLFSDTTLLKTYNGDFNNDGYFVFDSITPGTYTLITDYGDYKADTTNVTVTANQTSFKEIFPTAQSGKAPQVFSTSPKESSENVNTYSAIQLTFSKSMNTDSLITAFNAIPNINGTFLATQGNKIFTFTPDSALKPATNYQINLSVTAQSADGIKMSAPFSFDFRTADMHVYPEVVRTIPATQDSIAISKTIEVYFSQPMLPDKVVQAFSLMPQINGSFNWSDQNTHITFTPDSLLTADTTYTVTITSDALNTHFVALESNYSWQFKTRRRNNIHVLESFPFSGQDNISTKTDFFILLDAVPYGGSILGNLVLEADDGSQVAIQSWSIDQRYDYGVLQFSSRVDLKPNEGYSLFLLPGITDQESLPLKDTVMVHFTTQMDSYGSGTILDNFNSQTGWLNPDQSDSTQGTDPENTSFALSAAKKISSNTSAKLIYSFVSDSNGLVCISRTDPFEFTASDSSEFGLWIYGDYSFNTLELWFDVGGTGNKAVFVDTLNFAGWKLERFPLENIGSGNKSLTAIVLRQTANGYPGGTIYIDDIQYDVQVTGLEEGKAVTVKTFSLEQNYPNPFNPTTTIAYRLPEQARVKLIIYNALGQKIAILFDDMQSTGQHEVIWNAQNFASGIYYYRIEALTANGRKFMQVRKLLLLK